MKLQAILVNYDGNERIAVHPAYNFLCIHEKDIEATYKDLEGMNIISDGKFDGHSCRIAEFEEVNTIEK